MLNPLYFNSNEYKLFLLIIINNVCKFCLVAYLILYKKSYSNKGENGKLWMSTNKYAQNLAL